MDGLETWAALVIAACGFGGTIWAILVNRETLQTQNTMMFFERYARFDEAAPSELTEAGTELLARLTPQKRRQVLASARAYFNLCSEEYALGTKNRIDQDFWRIWLDGLKVRMAQPIWQDCWRELEADYRAQPAFWDFMAMGTPEFRGTIPSPRRQSELAANPAN
ncbi:MAG: hypothetical protein OEL78_09080 [Hyphomicrobiales bacterium]|nr:hypothetical protein [Hyphomicrobiales bacterium]